MNKKVTQDMVEKALSSLEGELSKAEVAKASDTDLDQPEGGDLGNPAKDKLSDEAKSKKPAKKMAKGESEEEEHEEEETADKEKKEEGKKKESEDEEGEDIEKNKKKAFAAAKKSFSEELPEDVQTKIDVSDFLKSLVDHTAESVDSLKEYVAKSEVANDARYSAIEDSVEEIQKSQAKIGIVLKAICQKIGVIAASPVAEPKAESIAKSEKIVEKQFNSSLAPESEEKVFKSLSDDAHVAKSQIANAMCDLVRKGEASDIDVINFESNGFIRPEVSEKLKTVL